MPSVGRTESGAHEQTNSMRYDPDKPVAAAEWLALDESEQHRIVECYHKHAGVSLPSSRVHAAIHAAIETQIAQGHGPATRALGRVMAQGLSRHDAVHALGSVMANHIFGIMTQSHPFDELRYTTDLDALSADQWRADSQED
jgi:hypothetical protein